MPSNTPKVALVTGSGKRRVGWYVAEALAQRGYAIAVHYRTSAADAVETIAHLKTLHIEARSFQADLGDERAVAALVRDVLGQFDRIDVLANCAAIWEAKKLEEVTAADVRRHFEVNTLGTFLCSQQAGLAMV